MVTASDAPLATRRRAIVLAAVLVFSFGYFYEGGGWNQNTRFDLIRAILETHSVRIDLYHENTGDKAHVGTHYYLDKAPGASLTALPAVALVRDGMHAFHAALYSTRAIVVYSWVATLTAAGFPAALAAISIFWMAIWGGADDRAATLAAVVCGLGTPLWAYATLFYGHTLAAGCLAGGLLAAIRYEQAPGGARAIRLGWLAGFAAGWAVVTEFPAVIPGAVICLYAASARWRRDPVSIVGSCLAIGAGLAVAAAVLLTYNWLAFAHPIYIAYTSEEGFAGMRTGLFGINLPSLSTARELLFGFYRGLLPLAPVLALAPIGYWFLLRDRRTRPAALVAAFVAVYYFLLTAGYVYWSGGWSYGSRHLAPAIPFLCLGLAPLWMRAPQWLRGIILALAIVGIGESLVAVATTPQPQADVERPMFDLLWPAFRSGDFPIGWQSYLELRPPQGPMSMLEAAGVPRASWNAGQLVGLNGFASLVPLLLAWAAAAAAWRRVRRS